MGKIMKIIMRVREWLRVQREERRKRSADKRQKELKRESMRMVQVKEFGGVVYVSYDGVPLVDVNSIVDSIPEALDDIRATYVEWMEKERR